MSNAPGKNKLSLEYLYLAGLIIIAIGLPLSRFLMSFGQMVLALYWLSHGNPINKFKNFLSNKAALSLTAIYLLYTIGLLWTSNMEYAMTELRIKLPLLILPLIISSSPTLNRFRFRLVLYTFITAVFLGTLCSMVIYFGWTSIEVTDIRHISYFISHIRFGLMICIAIFALAYFARDNFSRNKIISIGQLLLIAWLCFFLIFIESIGSLIILLIAGFVVFIYLVNKNLEKTQQKILGGIFLLIGLSVFFYLRSVVNDYYYIHPSQQEPVQTYTALGNGYVHNIDNDERENGYFVWRNVCEIEMHAAWNKVSAIPYEEEDIKGHQIKYTLIRYLTSRGLNKDSIGVSQLSKEDVTNIEQGFANYRHADIGNLRVRLEKILWQFDVYRKGGDPSGHSVTQRLEFWKIALSAIEGNLIFGFGTGDAADAYLNEFSKTDTQIKEEWQLKTPHNQYLSIIISLGILGLIVFLGSLFYSITCAGKWKNYFYITFLITALISMIPEDSLQMQAGVTFFAFFNCFFLFAQPKK